MEQRQSAPAKTDVKLTAFPRSVPPPRIVWAAGTRATQLSGQLGWVITPELEKAEAFFMDSPALYTREKERIDQLVASGNTVVLLELPAGDHAIADSKVNMGNTIMG